MMALALRQEKSYYSMKEIEKRQKVCKISSHCFMAVRPFKCKMMDLLLKLDKERNETTFSLFSIQASLIMAS